MKVFRTALAVTLLVCGLSTVVHAGTIDPGNDGSYTAVIENTDLGSATTINFGKFTTQSAKNITVSDTELTGFAWGEGVGWIVLNCANTVSGCSSTNANFKVANDGTGNLSGYAWGENTGWINFGPFSNPAISTVKIANGEFGGTLGSAGYAWAQNYGYIRFDCSDPSSCVKTDWSASGSTQCSDGVDNDGDSAIDYPDDSGCTDANDDSERSGGGGGGAPQCRDNVDNDGDGYIDYPADPGCADTEDDREIDPIFQCNDGIDNDGDGLIDYPSDPGCVGATDDDEISAPPVSYQCSDTIDNDGDGKVDLLDPGCMSAFDDSEIDPIVPVSYQCSDGIDNDGDILIDYPNDPGCTSASDNNEVDPIVSVYQCIDGIDNDGDGLIDYPSDPGCDSIADNDEFNITRTFCDDNPTDPSCTADYCDSHPNTPECTQHDFCREHPTDAACRNPTYCATYPELCFPPKGPKLPEIIGEHIKTFATGTVGTVTKIASVAVVAAGAGVAALIANPFSLYDLFLILARLWSLLLIALGVKKKSRPWGVVYDSVTKQPIDPAYVVLMDMAGNEVATSITDIEGRYGFSVPAGTYMIMVNKTNYDFPSKKLIGKNEDELYRDLYFGGPIVVTEEGGIIGKNIPLDQQNFDWNEYAKNEQHRLRMYKRHDLLVARISNVAFIIGFIITGVSVFVVPSTFNIVLTILYVLMALARIFKFQVQPKGSVADSATDRALPFSVVRVVSNATNKEVKHMVADRTGKYYALIANGDYHVVVDRKNADQSYTPVSVPDPVEVKKGYLKRDFKI